MNEANGRLFEMKTRYQELVTREREKEDANWEVGDKLKHNTYSAIIVATWRGPDPRTNGPACSNTMLTNVIP